MILNIKPIIPEIPANLAVFGLVLTNMHHIIKPIIGIKNPIIA